MQQADGQAKGRSEGQITGQIPGQFMGQAGGSGDGVIAGRPGPLGAEMSSSRRSGRRLDLPPLSGPVADAPRNTRPDDAAIWASPSEGSAQSLAGLIHDARNMVSAMDLYCELLEEPGVLAFPFRHYAGELRMVSTAGRLLLERLAVAESISGLESGLESGLPIGLQPAASDPAGARLSRVEQAGATAHPKTPLESWPRTGSLPVSQSEGVPWPQRAFAEQIGGVEELWAQGGLRPVFQPGSRVRNLAEELEASRNLISALVGHGIPVTLTISGGRKPVAMTGDDLTRVLVNLARNAAEAMPCGGRLEIALEEDAEFMVLSFRDDGPGIPKEALEAIFASGYSTRGGLHAVANSRPESGQVSGADAALEFNAVSHSGRWPVQHRGLGLSIVRSIVASAGGSIWATNRGDAHGAIFVIEFPMIEPSPT